MAMRSHNAVITSPLAARSWLIESVARWSLPDVLLALAAAAYIAAFAGTGLLRAIYPYPIDGIEPGALQEARRVMAGQPLYVKPELGYVPFIYGPVYFYFAGLIGKLTGTALLGVRLAS